MAIIIDANLLVALVSGDTRGDKVLKHFMNWIDNNFELHSPSLAKYEIANALTRLIVANAFPKDKLVEALNNISLVPITYHLEVDSLSVIDIALRLGRQNAYDASYLALSEELNSELWTIDGSLYRNAIGHGFNIKLIS